MQDLTEIKAANLGHLLLRAARLWDEAAVARVRALTGREVRTAHTRLFPHLPLEGGIRPTELAARVGISKQAVGKLLDDLAEDGLIERFPDPDDRRAQLVRFSARGQEALLHGLSVFAGMEAELRAGRGEAEVGALRAGLAGVLGWLEDGAARG